MQIFAVSEPYEAPCEYFATRELAEAFVAKCHAYQAEWQAWAESPESATVAFESKIFPGEASWVVPMSPELYIDAITVQS